MRNNLMLMSFFFLSFFLFISVQSVPLCESPVRGEIKLNHKQKKVPDRNFLFYCLIKDECDFNGF